MRAVRIEGAGAVLHGPLRAALADCGLLEPDVGTRRTGTDRNLVFASAMCEGNASRALRELRHHPFVVVGCGGLGSTTAIALAALGARNLSLIDGDRVEPSNLNRLVWAGDRDVGTPKVTALAATWPADSTPTSGHIPMMLPPEPSQTSTARSEAADRPGF